jgi:hypothetical protein
MIPKKVFTTKYYTIIYLNNNITKGTVCPEYYS